MPKIVEVVVALEVAEAGDQDEAREVVREAFANGDDVLVGGYGFQISDFEVKGLL